ncbi:OmpW/AlkL family protein [Thalassotalea piscium]|uniref:Outer membrane protein n=1 Tax=Thalassotalea piscium TaxID=1230533 RepID=A0A7X0NHH1_9GAMM|nr:OmpW family outer membrane protein [Thalassotalea piscium]MBB6543551.1 outer membrane protein [Thalassotalea piscium]
MKKSILTIALLSVISITNAADYKAGDIVVRGGVTNVTPNSDHSAVMLGGADSTMSLAVDDNAQIGLNFVYFYDKNWAIEVLAATPFTHDVTIYDPNAILNVDGAKLAEVSHLPPTVSAVYYFDTMNNIKPYLGLGLNYTVFFDEGFESAPKSLGLSNLALDGSFGLSIQAGFDFNLNQNWHINTSIRYIDIDTEATFDVGGNNIGKANISIDPTVFSVLIGYKF